MIDLSKPKNPKAPDLFKDWVNIDNFKISISIATLATTPFIISGFLINAEEFFTKSSLFNLTNFFLIITGIFLFLASGFLILESMSMKATHKRITGGIIDFLGIVLYFISGIFIFILFLIG